jgi:hypothetical protein
MPSDVAALQAFLDAGGCDYNGALLITEADLKGRTTIPVSELLEMSRKKVTENPSYRHAMFERTRAQNGAARARNGPRRVFSRSSR